MKRRVVVVLTTLAVLFGAGAVAATAAHAAYDGCTFGYVCLYDGNGGTGTRHSYHVVSGFCTNINDVPNTANSFYNRRSDNKHVQFYNGLNCTGGLLCEHANSFGAARCPGDLDDPLPSGRSNNFLYAQIRGPGEINHRNKASSIWGNNG